MLDKELKQLSLLQEVCDRRITQSKAAHLLQMSERQIQRLMQGYKVYGPAASAHASRGQPSNSNVLKTALKFKTVSNIQANLNSLIDYLDSILLFNFK